MGRPSGGLVFKLGGRRRRRLVDRERVREALEELPKRVESTPLEARFVPCTSIPRLRRCKAQYEMPRKEVRRAFTGFAGRLAGGVGLKRGQSQKV
jgi:hypothetical protein